MTMTEPREWLHALDPLDTGRARFVRAFWTTKFSDATFFPSRTYAQEVADNTNANVIRPRHYRIHRVDPKPESKEPDT